MNEFPCYCFWEFTISFYVSICVWKIARIHTSYMAMESLASFSDGSNSALFLRCCLCVSRIRLLLPELTWQWNKSFRTMCFGWSNPVVTAVRRTQETWANYFFVKNVCQILRKAFEVWNVNSASGFNSDLLFGANADRIHSTAWLGLSRSNSVRSISRASAGTAEAAGHRHCRSDLQEIL